MNLIGRARLLIISHKLISFAVFISLFLVGYYLLGFSSETVQATYVLGQVERGNIISAVEGSGQIVALNESDIKSEVSGDITWINMVAGQEVKKGQVLAIIDNTEIQKSIAEAEVSLTEAKLQHDKDLAQASIDYQKKLESLESSKKDLEKTYESVFNTISNAFLDLPTVVTGLEDILYGNGLSSGGTYYNIDVYKNYFGYDNANSVLINAFVSIADSDYKIARSDFDANFLNFKDITRYADRETLENLLDEIINTTKAIAQSAKSDQNLLDTIVDISQSSNRTVPSAIATFQTKLKSYIGTINSNLSSLMSQQSSLDNIKQQIINTQRDIDIYLINNPDGDNPISLQIAKNSIVKKIADFEELKEQLADYTIRAPFDGVIAKVNAQIFDSVSNGTVLATIITNQQLAEISLNEIDVAEIKVGQKVSLAFDAVDELSLTGQVYEVDTIGTVSQGVVNYTVKISLDSQDSRIKPGMSVTASIITDSKLNVLVIPTSAIKISQGVNYVEIPDDTEIPAQISNTSISLQKPFVKQQIEVGSSSGTYSEILNGVVEGDKIVLRTVSGQSPTGQGTNQSAGGSTNIRIPGMGMGF